MSSVSPKTGSRFGNTQIKIIGNNFGTDLTKVKVQLGDKGTDCIVGDVINEAITCTTTSPSNVVELTNDGKHAGTY